MILLVHAGFDEGNYDMEIITRAKQRLAVILIWDEFDKPKNLQHRLDNDHFYQAAKEGLVEVFDFSSIINSGDSLDSLGASDPQPSDSGQSDSEHDFQTTSSSPDFGNRVGESQEPSVEDSKEEKKGGLWCCFS